MRSIGVLLLMLPAQLGVPGCGRDARSAPDQQTGPRTAVPVVANVSPKWGENEGWRLAERPSAAIGVLDGDRRYQFERISQVIRLRDGRIIVTDAQREMRYFDSTGRHLLTVGGEGSGPGEFRQLWAPYELAPDSLVLLDIANRRFSVYDSAGRFIRDFPFERRLSYPTGMALLADRTAIGLGELPLESVPEGASRPLLPLIRFDLEGDFVDTLASVPGWSWFRTGSSLLATPFSRAPLLAARDSMIWLVMSDSAELRALAPDATHRRLVLIDRPRRPVTDEDREMWQTRRAGMRRESSRPALTPPLPDSFPHFSRLIIGTDHHVWLRRYAPEWERGETWDVFTPDGVWLGPITMPTPFLLTHAGSEHVAGIWRDADDVNYARVYRLIRKHARDENASRP